MGIMASEAVINKHLDSAVILAERSTIKTFSTGALIVPRNAAPVGGWSHDSLFKLTNFRSIHAEVHAIFRAQREALKDATIFVATIRNKSGNIGLARPCDGCLSYLYEVGIKRAYFTVEGEEYDYLDIAS